MVRILPTWGAEQVADELLLTLGLRVSPRTVRTSLSPHWNCRAHTWISSQRWRTFVANHARAMVACDVCVVVTATFCFRYVLVLIEHATRRILH